jgi:hypothetical protein
MVGLAAPRIRASSAARKTARSAALSTNTQVISTAGDDAGKSPSVGLRQPLRPFSGRPLQNAEKHIL